uniref:Uncharacterized protein n=1 Tax=Panagrolaimus sp. JU765 TaxID=591449 RepID=A0AC34QIL1_9BILA
MFSSCFAVVHRHKASEFDSFVVMNQTIKNEHIHETAAGRKLFFTDLCRQLVKKVDSPQFTDRALFLKTYASRQPRFEKHF